MKISFANFGSFFIFLLIKNAGPFFQWFKSKKMFIIVLSKESFHVRSTNCTSCKKFSGGILFWYRKLPYHKVITQKKFFGKISTITGRRSNLVFHYGTAPKWCKNIEKTHVPYDHITPLVWQICGSWLAITSKNMFLIPYRP